MQNILKKIGDFFSNLWKKTSTVAKIIVGAAILLLIILIIILIATSSRPDMVSLVKGPLSEGDYNRVKQELDTRGEPYKANPQTRSIYVESPTKATKLRTELALDDKLQDKDGYELFDQQSFTTTEFERNVNLQRSLVNAVTQHIESLDDIERAEVKIAFPKIDNNSLWLKEKLSDPLTASVIITPSPNSTITEDKKRIRGLQNLVARSVDRLEPENVHIFDHKGNELTAIDSSDDVEYSKLLNMNKFRQSLKREIKKEIEDMLIPIFDSERYTIVVNTDVNRSSGESVSHRIEPIVIKGDNPDTPSDESKVEVSVPISKQDKREVYRGQVFIPEGSPSAEFNFPPGGKQISDQYNTYTMDNTIVNNEISTKDIVVTEPAGEQLFINASIGIDYNWEWDKDPETAQIKEDEITRTRSRIYTPVEQQELDKIRKSVETYINNSKVANPGKVSVETLLFRSTLDKHKEEDEAYFRQKDTQRALLYSAIGLGIVVLLILLFFWIRGIIRERRRRREEELARQRQAMREAALRAAEQEGVILDMSPEDKARLEMQENAIRLARERPEDVAKLLRTWLSED